MRRTPYFTPCQDKYIVQPKFIKLRGAVKVVCQAGLYPFIYQGLRCTVLTQTLPIMPAPQPNMMAKLDVPHGCAVQFVFTSTVLVLVCSFNPPKYQRPPHGVIEPRTSRQTVELMPNSGETERLVLCLQSVQDR
jgi:hypothetical protein